jgi:hypothetical protein
MQGQRTHFIPKTKQTIMSETKTTTKIIKKRSLKNSYCNKVKNRRLFTVL